MAETRSCKRSCRGRAAPKGSRGSGRAVGRGGTPEPERLANFHLAALAAAGGCAQLELGRWRQQPTHHWQPPTAPGGPTAPMWQRHASHARRRLLQATAMSAQAAAALAVADLQCQRECQPRRRAAAVRGLRRQPPCRRRGCVRFHRRRPGHMRQAGACSRQQHHRCARRLIILVFFSANAAGGRVEAGNISRRIEDLRLNLMTATSQLRKRGYLTGDWGMTLPHTLRFRMSLDDVVMFTIRRIWTAAEVACASPAAWHRSRLRRNSCSGSWPAAGTSAGQASDVWVTRSH